MDKDPAAKENVTENPFDRSNIRNIKKILHLKHWNILKIHSPFQEAHTKLLKKYRKL
jgi:hypothetical protein